MENFDLLVNLDKDKLQKLAIKQAEMLAHRTIAEHIGDLFKVPQYYREKPIPAGPALQLVQQMVDDLLLSDEYKKKITNMAEHMLQEALQKAVEKRVQHLMNKAAFEMDLKIQDKIIIANAGVVFKNKCDTSRGIGPTIV